VPEVVEEAARLGGYLRVDPLDVPMTDWRAEVVATSYRNQAFQSDGRETEGRSPTVLAVYENS
jgi:hypothetical protein